MVERARPAASINAIRRRLISAGTALLVLPVVPRLAQAATLLAVRTWPADAYTRVTLELNSELKTQHFTLEHPDRLVVDIDGLTASHALDKLVSEVRPNDPYIKSLRVAQNRPNVVRLVFDLKQPVAPQVFTLKPVADYQYRLVLDLYPKVAQDPLLAVLNDKRAGPDVDDPLAHVLDQIARSEKQNGDAAPVPLVRGQTAPRDPVAPSVALGDPPMPQRPGRKRMLTIAVDPGHGGEDPGAIGRTGLYEKVVVLHIADRLKSMINSQPNMRAYLTRDSDFFVPLNVRVEKARRAGADLFVSIHADAFIKPSARGSSVFALSEHGASSAQARWMANRENSSDLVGGVNLSTHDAQVARVLLDLSTTAQINDSLKLGSVFLGELAKINRLHSHQVEQAGFAVLKAPDIPSVLVESAFISNPEEEAKLRTAVYREQVAQALMAGISQYFTTNPPLARTVADAS